MINMAKNNWKKAGEVGVDAGLIWVGDPCYVLGDDSTHRVTDWLKFCDILDHNKNVNEPLGERVGLAISSGYGDGRYPVYIKEEDGRVKAIRIEFF